MIPSTDQLLMAKQELLGKLREIQQENELKEQLNQLKQELQQDALKRDLLKKQQEQILLMNEQKDLLNKEQNALLKDKPKDLLNKEQNALLKEEQNALLKEEQNALLNKEQILMEQQGLNEQAFQKHQGQPLSMSELVQQHATVCHHCGLPSKYTCPACQVKSCSLACITAHKQKTSCSGQRNKTKFIPISKYNLNHLMSDFKFLEQVERVTQEASKDNKKRTKPKGKQQQLANEAKKHNIYLCFMPQGMKRGTLNRSLVNKSGIQWTVELKFMDLGEERLVHRWFNFT